MKKRSSFFYAKWFFFAVLSFFSVFLVIKLEDLFFGILAAWLLDHFVEVLEDFGLNHYVSLIIVLITLAAIFTCFFLFFLPEFIKNMLEVIQYVSELIKNPDNKDFEIKLLFRTFNYKFLLTAFNEFIERNFNPSSGSTGGAGKFLISALNPKGFFFKFLSNSINTILGFLTTITISRYLFKYMKSSDSVEVREICQKIRDRIKLFLFNQFIIALFNFLFFSMVLSFFGVRGWLAVGLSSFTGSFVTSFGSLIGIVMSIGTVLVQRFHWHSLLLMLFILVIPYVVENYVLLPYLICKPLKINYALIIIAVVGIMKIAGAKYVLFSIPLIITCRLLINRIYNYFTKSSKNHTKLLN